MQLCQHLLGISAVLQLHYSFCQGFVASSPQRLLVTGPDPATKPDYDAIHGPLGAAVDQVFLRIFHASLHEQVRGKPYQQEGSSSATFDDIAQLAREMSQTEPPAVVQAKSLAVLRSLFPSWLPRQYKIWFSGPFPAFSCRMNAWATYVAGTWLMGECHVNDVVSPRIMPSQGLHVQRCRFLESSGCASICVNACKIPTQTFFRDEMGIDLLMEPNYETYECQFSFGMSPTAETELAALQTPCLAACPTVNRQRRPTTTTTTITTAVAAAAAVAAEITTTTSPPLSLLCALSDAEE
jgi:Beta-carotene isomerase D27-like, C-terminal